jgi:four helix bundle protein
MLVERVHGNTSFRSSQTERINPDASTSILHAGLSSTRHLESRDGLRRRRLRVRCEPADAEKYNLASQLRRAAASVPLNIAEGCGTASNTEFDRFLSYAYHSLKEVVTGLELSQRLYPLLQERTASLIDEGNQISRMVYNLMQKVDPEIKTRW